MKNRLKSIYPYLFALLFILVPFDEHARALPNTLIIILGICFPFIVAKNDLKNLRNPIFIIFISLIGYLLLNSLILDRFSENFSVIKKILLSGAIVLLAIPLKSERNKIDYAIIFSSIVAIAFSLYNIMVLVYNTGSFEFGNSQNAIDSLLIDRLYLGLICVLSVIISFKNLIKKDHPHKKYYVVNILLNVLFVFLIVSRIAIIILAILLIVQQFYGKGKLKRIFISLMAIVIVSTIAFTINDNLSKRFFYETEVKNEKSLIQKTLDWEPRTVIWACAVKIGNSDIVFLSGIGFQSLREELVTCYEQYIQNPSRREWFLFKKFNSHNQFIEFYIGTGFLSVLLFCMVFFVPLIKNYKSYFITSLLITIFLFGSIESFFYRQIGAIYFGLFIILVLFEKSKNSVEAEKFN